jgi:hypothetical protein
VTVTDIIVQIRTLEDSIRIRTDMRQRIQASLDHVQSPWQKRRDREDCARLKALIKADGKRLRDLRKQLEAA